MIRFLKFVAQLNIIVMNRKICMILLMFSMALWHNTLLCDEVNVIEPHTIVYDWDFDVLHDGTVLTAWNGPGLDGKGITTYFNVHDDEGNTKFADGAMLVDCLESKLYTTAKQLTLLDRDNNTIIAYQTLDNAVKSGLDTDVNENYRLYKISPEGEMMWGGNGIDLNRGGYSEATQGCLSMVQIEDGSFFIAWVEYVWNNDYEIGTIRMERVSQDGEMIWDEPLIIGDGVTPMTFPYLVNAGNNQVIMVYAKGSVQELHAKKLDFDGTEVWGQDTRIYRHGFGTIPIWTFLNVMSDEEGGAFVGWYDDRNGTNLERTYVAHILPDGSHGFVSGEGGEAIGYSETMRSFEPSIYYDKENQNVYVLRRESSVGQSHYRLVLQKLSMAGELLWDVEGVEVYPYSDINIGYECISDDGDGNIAIFFMTNNKISDADNVTNLFTKVSKEDGTPVFENPIVFSTTSDNKMNLQISNLIDDEYWIAMWEDKRILPDDDTDVDITELPRRLYMRKIFKDGTVDSPYNVSTKSKNKKILIEEFTGIKCGNCPDGHAMAKQIQMAKDDEVFIMAIHAGPYAEAYPDQPDFCTEDGEAIHDFFVPNGYPSGMVNRREYNGDIVIGRSSWTRLARDVNAETAPVNLWLDLQYDDFYESLTVTIEGYWTDDAPCDAPKMSVALLQNNIQGYQAGSGIGDEYMHQHVLRDYLSDAFGDEIPNCNKGDFFTMTYNYNLPNDYNGVVVVPEQLEVLIFVTENESNILNVEGKKLSHHSFDLPLTAEISEPKIPINRNYFYSFLEMYLENKSTTPVTNALFELDFNGATEQVRWTGKLEPLSKKQISIPIDWSRQNEENEWSVKLIALNDTDYDGNTINGTFGKTIDVPNNIIIKIKTDNYSDDNRFMIKDINGNIVKELDGFTNGIQETKEYDVELEKDKVYCLEITDTWGDGMLTPRGHVKVYSNDNTLLTQNLEIADFGWRVFLNVVEETDIPELQYDDISVKYFDDNIKIDCSQNFEACVYDVSGRCVLKGRNMTNISTSSLIKGIYIVDVITSESNKTIKIIK